MQEECPNCKGNHIAFSGKCAKKTAAIRMARQGRRLQLERPETGSVTGVNRVALGTRPMRDTINQEGELKAEEENITEREVSGGAEGQRLGKQCLRLQPILPHHAYIVFVVSPLFSTLHPVEGVRPRTGESRQSGGHSGGHHFSEAATFVYYFVSVFPLLTRDLARWLP